MSQRNLRVRRVFQEALARFMRLRRISSKREAIRVAVDEPVQRLERTRRPDFHAWIGAALEAPLNEAPRFGSRDELW